MDVTEQITERRAIEINSVEFYLDETLNRIAALSLSMKEHRRSAQSEAHSIAMAHMAVGGMDRFSRDEGDDDLGKTWSSIAYIYPQGSVNASDFDKAVRQLEKAGFIVGVEYGDRTYMHVRTSHEVHQRHTSNK